MCQYKLKMFSAVHGLPCVMAVKPPPGKPRPRVFPDMFVDADRSILVERFNRIKTTIGH